MTKLTTIAKQILQEKGSDFWGKQPFGQDRNVLPYFINRFVEEKSKKKDLHKEMLEYVLMSPTWDTNDPWNIETILKDALGVSWFSSSTQFSERDYTRAASKSTRKAIFGDDYKELQKIETGDQLKKFKMKNGWSIWELRRVVIRFFAWFDKVHDFSGSPIAFPTLKAKFDIDSEPNTEDENELGRALKRWYGKANKDSAGVFTKYYDDILYAKKKFPKIFNPSKDAKNVFRGTRLDGTLFNALFNTKKTDWVTVKIEGESFKKLKNPVSYKPQRDAQSWSASIMSALDFTRDGAVLMTTLSDNFFMTPDSSAEIGKFKKEKEIIHVTSDIKKPVYIIIIPNLYKRIFDHQSDK